MPIYTYKCKNCGKTFEKMQKMGASGSQSCEYCNSETLQVFLPAGIIFKGSGFYTTDYKSGSNKANLNTDNKKEEKKDTAAQQKENKPDSQSPKPQDKTASSSTSDKAKV